MATYIAILRKERGSDYGVSFPDLPGCATAGSTLDEARRHAAEALALHLEGLVEEGLEVPAPSTLDAVVEAGEISDGGVPFLVEAPMPEGRAVRVNITIPEPVLGAIDRYVEQIGGNRSAFLTHAAKTIVYRFTGATIDKLAAPTLRGRHVVARSAKAAKITSSSKPRSRERRKEARR